MTGLVFASAFSFFVAESIVRAGIALRVSTFRNPDLYADWSTDDDYWKLRHLWGKNVMVHGELYDPLLGWGIPVTDKNPLGAVTDRPYEVDAYKPAVLFVGDAFVEGVTRMDKRLPQLVGNQLSTPVYNLGMSGYGLDQIFLKLQQARHSVKKPTAVVGVVSIDLDRTLQSFRTGPKPYFTLLNDHLMLKGVPVPRDPQTWLEKHPVKIESYLGSLVMRKLRRFQTSNSLEETYGKEEKKALNAAILKELICECHDDATPLLFVLFTTKEELNYEGWREKFLKTELRRSQIDFVDAKYELIHEARKAHRNVYDYFLSEGHLTAEANSLIANAVAKRLKEMSNSALN